MHRPGWIESAKATFFFALHSTEGTCVELSEHGFELVTRPGHTRGPMTVAALLAAVAIDLSRRMHPRRR